TVYPLAKARRGIVIRCEVVQLTVRPKDEPLLGCAKPRRVLDQSVENGLKLEGRAADDLEHVGGGGLLLQRFAELVEQPRILDRDHGLVGETLDQLDLLVGERSDLLPKNVDNTNQLALFEHRDREHCSKAAQFNGFDDLSKPFSVGLRCPD